MLYYLYIFAKQFNEYTLYSAVKFKDLGMINYYYNMGYTVYLILEVNESDIKELQCTGFDLCLTQHEVQNMIDIALYNNVRIHKYGIDFLN